MNDFFFPPRKRYIVLRVFQVPILDSDIGRRYFFTVKYQHCNSPEKWQLVGDFRGEEATGSGGDCVWGGKAHRPWRVRWGLEIYQLGSCALIVQAPYCSIF